MAKTVLLVEDEPNITEAISFLLERDGWTVRIHACGATALDAVQNTAPDVLILDAMLPGRSGFDILCDIRQCDACADLPVLMLTARGQQKDRELAYGYGVSHFMTKPFSNAQMVQVVNALLDGPAQDRPQDCHARDKVS